METTKTPQSPPDQSKTKDSEAKMWTFTKNLLQLNPLGFMFFDNVGGFVPIYRTNMTDIYDIQTVGFVHAHYREFK
jgi:hypothetical protein